MDRFSPGAVAVRTAAVLRRHFAAFALLAIAIHLPTIVLVGMYPEAGESRFLGLLDNLLGFVATGAVISGALRALDGERPELAAMTRVGLARIWRVFGASLLAGLAILLGLAALVVPGLVVGAAVAVAVPVAVAEERGATDAITRSFELTKGSRIPVLGFAGTALAVLVATGAGVSLALAAGSEAAELPPGPVAAAVEVLGVLAAAVFSVALAATYHALKVQKEGAATTQVAAVFE